MILAQYYLARQGEPFTAYMALQRALIARYVARGGSAELWCQRMAPVFHRRYAMLLPPVEA